MWVGDVRYQPRTPTALTAVMERMLKITAERMLEGRGGRAGSGLALVSGERRGVVTERCESLKGEWTTMVGGLREAVLARRR